MYTKKNQSTSDLETITSYAKNTNRSHLGTLEEKNGCHLCTLKKMYEKKLYSHSTKACSIEQSDCSHNVSIKHARLLFKIRLTIY
jgi:hypothetical protein